MFRRRRPPAPRHRAAGVLLSAALAVLVGGLFTPAAAASEGDPALHLVTLHGTGLAGYDGPLSSADYRTLIAEEQDDTLAAVGATRPLYRWATALNGFAVELTPDQVDGIEADPRVAAVEPNTVLPLAALAAGESPADAAPDVPARGGAGTVIGVVDSGIWPDNPLFAAVPGLGRDAERFEGRCVPGQDWGTDTCNDKLVGARWFVAGFGTDNLRSTSSLSARDDDGHGTHVASIAAGNAGVSVQLADEAMGTYGGAAPQARLAVYKACWTAPDPADDGCASADVVTAVDRAVADGVDVLNLSVAGASALDTVGRALLGAAEADVVVTTAAGNAADQFAAHGSPWVTTVGASTGVQRRGELTLSDGTTLAGAMSSTRTVPATGLVHGRDAGSDGSPASAAAQCRPGSLDAGRIGGRIVLCDRGGIGRVDKSAAVALADGVGMVLLNHGRGGVSADIHAVPTVHLRGPAAARLRAALAADPDLEAGIAPDSPVDTPRVPAWSSAGDPRGGVVKPDLVAPATGVLGAVPPRATRDLRWDFLNGTSAASARVSGQAAVLRSARPTWSAAMIRSALATTAQPVTPGLSSLRQGSGITSRADSVKPGLVLDVRPGDYRRYADGRLDPLRLNTPSVLLGRDRGAVRREVTHVGDESMYYSVSTSGFSRHRVQVTPAAIRIAPGETKSFTIRVTGGGAPGRLDSGWVTWLGADDTEVRIPVVIAR